jgi:acyl-[acyl-carrier-protein]-phospholipid O-acyltransferase/long-chain-fatty-acid--[acyl-carrier-protein] ligase
MPGRRGKPTGNPGTEGGGMNEDSFARQPVRKGIVGGVALLSALVPVYVCAYSALLVYEKVPVFDRQALNVLLFAAVYTVPFLFTGVFCQFLCTRFSARNVVVFSRAVEIFLILAGSFFLAPVRKFGPVPLLVFAACLGVVFSFYRPALKIYLADTADKKELSRTAGVVESMTFLGIILGTVSAVFCIHFISSTAAIAAAGVSLATLNLLLTSHLNPNQSFCRKLRFRDLKQQWVTAFKLQQRYRELVLTGIGEGYIFASIILISSMAMQYISVKFGSSASGNDIVLYAIIASPVIGAVLGCLAAGKLSGDMIEIGLVPPSTVVMTLAALLIGVLPFIHDQYTGGGLLPVLLFAFGFFAGVMLVPLEAYQKYFIRHELIPPFFSWFYLPFAGGILLTILMSFLMYYYGLSIFTITLILACLTIILGVTSFYIMPQFLLRFLMRTMLRTLYRLRTFGVENIPEEGPALLVGNRASFVDIIFIQACTSRPVRFMMHESYFNVPFWKPLFKSAGFISVPSNKPKQLKALLEYTQDLLRQGELVCIFPEGDITKNGTMSSFKDGLAELMPADMPEIPVIPVRIGMTWGSIFSCYYGKFKLTWPNELPHPASVTVGKPIPRDTSAYEIRIILSELAADTELIPERGERPFHSQFAWNAKHLPFRRTIQQYDDAHGLQNPTFFSLLVKTVLISRWIRRICDESEEYVGVMLPNSLAAVCTITGVLMADRKPAVMNFTAGIPANQHAVKIANIRHILTSRVFIQKIRMKPTPEMVFLEDAAKDIGRPSSKYIWLLACIFLSHEELMKLVSPKSWQDVNRIAVLIFSSGSTGIPKGIMLTHHNINADVAAMVSMIGWRKTDSVLGNLPIFHSFGLTVCMWLPIVTATRAVFIANALDAAMSLKVIREQKISIVVATPSFLMLYMRKGTGEDFKSLRLAITGAERLREDIAEKFRRMTGLEITEGYGCTELSPVVSINVANSRMELGVQVAKPGSIGAPLPGICAKIVDPSTFELMPENTDGLMIVKGAIVMKGYLGEPGKTAEVIRDGWYVTGDIAHMNRNGFITITGRLSRFSKIAGEMVPHELVEREINNILQPEERLVAVCGAADAKHGEKLIVFYTDARRLAPDELIRQLKDRQIPNLWIPKAENFILVDSLPMLGNGKLDLAALVELAKKYSDPTPAA